MDRNEFDKFYSYITAVALNDNGEKMKEAHWNALGDMAFDQVMDKAKEVYKSFSCPCELCLLNPKVFRGEILNPGLFGVVICQLPC